MNEVRRCFEECGSYISSRSCSVDFTSTRDIKEGDLCHNCYSSKEIEEDRAKREQQTIEDL